jgi:uncharacterized protein (DUF2141 family)
MTMHRSSVLLLLFLATAGPAAAAFDLRVLVTGIESDEGEIACILFDQAKGFPLDAERAVATKRYAAVPGMLTCTFSDVPEGRYAVSASHDENANQKIDANLLGFIKEPWGVSNNVRPASRAPRFLEASVKMSGERSLDLEVAIQK